MGSIPEQNSSTGQALLDAQLDLWHNTFAFIKSMAFKCALELRIADAIHHHGGIATLTQIAGEAKVHPSKIPCLRRLMRVLTVTGIFSIAKNPAEDGDHVYGLTPASRLLAGPQNLTPTLSLILHNTFVSPFLGLGTWIEHELLDLALFQMAHGKTVWDVIIHDAAISSLFNAGMIADSRFLMDIAIKECGHVFQGISSMIDVAGGHGAAAQAIAMAFPHIDCSVLDLEHVIANAPVDTKLKYIAGGKVIIVDAVVGAGSSTLKHRETQVLYDLFIMVANGIERDEKEWRKIIFEAGFTHYKIIPVLGVRSIIEVYP
ncbi:unnamed protein product [Urochloa decumbens]|uniref:O-methyltransferase ZRP4 n=1 Tax=Urochloa decumbens TaxID=240449 RepID=A0ABC9BQL7_9POAL